MDTKTPNKRKLRLAASAAAASAVALLATVALPSASSASPSANTGGSVLTMESSPESAIPQNFNPYVQSTAPYAMGADSLIYEPLMDFDLALPSNPPYYFLATAYTWGSGGKSITFKIRTGVDWSNGSAMT